MKRALLALFVALTCLYYCQPSIDAAKWPETCQHDIGYVIDWEGYDPLTTSLTKEEAAAAIQRGADWWSSKLNLKIYARQDFGPQSRCLIRWKRLAGNTLAWSSLADDLCTDDKAQAYDLRNWSAQYLEVTAAHEFGHLIGLTHYRNSLMNPSIIPTLTELTDVDIRRAKSLGYQDRVEDPDQEPPDPEPQDPDDPQSDRELVRLLFELALEFVEDPKLKKVIQLLLRII